MSKPAKKEVDATLFAHTSPAIKALQKKSREELRLKARKEWKARNATR